MVFMPMPGLVDLQVGTDVFAPWDEGWLYPAVIVERDGDDAIVAYWEGESARFAISQLRPLSYREGDRVHANWENVNEYEDGVITKRVGGGVQIKLQNGNVVWTTWAKCRIALESDQ